MPGGLCVGFAFRFSYTESDVIHTYAYEYMLESLDGLVTIDVVVLFNRIYIHER